MQTPPSPLRPLKRVNKKRRARKKANKNSISLGSLRSIADGVPKPPSPSENQPSRQAVKQAVDELKLFVSKVDMYSELHRKGLITVRLEKEHGKGDPPVVVPNNYIYYFGYQPFSFESTKFGSTIHPSRMSEPDYFGALLAQPEYCVPIVGTTVGPESPVEACFLEMMRFVQPSQGEVTPVVEPELEEQLEADRVDAAQPSLEAGPEYWLWAKVASGRQDFGLDEHPIDPIID